MCNEYGTLGIFVPIGSEFTIGGDIFTVKGVRYNNSQEYYTCMLTYNESVSAVVLYQHKEIVFYAGDTRYFLWLGKRTNRTHAHVFISAPKNIKITRGE